MLSDDYMIKTLADVGNQLCIEVAVLMARYYFVCVFVEKRRLLIYLIYMELHGKRKYS